jgi:ABC-type Fe3+ transport system permease subunit
MAALTQVHPALEEAAENLGAGRWQTIRRIVIPLMMGGILAGFVTSFITAAAEISETILLTSRESLAPMSYGIYLYFQSIAGRGPGAALSVIAITLVSILEILRCRLGRRGYCATLHYGLSLENFSPCLGLPARENRPYCGLLQDSISIRAVSC